MTNDDIRDTIASAIRRIAPEVDPSALTGRVHLREALELDSMDFLNLMIAIHERLGIEVPESDYARLATLDGAVEYVASRMTAAGRGAR